MTSQYRALIASTAAQFDLSATLLEAQVWQESSDQADAFRFEPTFYRHYVKDNPQSKAATFGPLAACSYGLLQIMLETACEHGFSGQPWDLFEPVIGLFWGAKYLAHLRDHHGADMRAALLAYNGGADANYPTRVLLREQELDA